MTASTLVHGIEAVPMATQETSICRFQLTIEARLREKSPSANSPRRNHWHAADKMQTRTTATERLLLLEWRLSLKMTRYVRPKDKTRKSRCSGYAQNSTFVQAFDATTPP